MLPVIARVSKRPTYPETRVTGNDRALVFCGSLLAYSIGALYPAPTAYLKKRRKLRPVTDAMG